MDEQTSSPGRAASLAAELSAVLSRLKRRMREYSGHNDLTPSQTSVLLRLESSGPAAVSTLARAESMRPQSMSSIIQSLQQAGLVTGTPDPRDGRQTLMALSTKCERLIKAGRTARRDWLTAAIQSKLSPKEQDRLFAATRLLERLLEP